MSVRRKISVGGGHAATGAQTKNEVAHDADASASLGAESSVSVAVQAFRDGFLDRGEQAHLAGRASQEPDRASKAFLETVAGYGAGRIEGEQTAATQKHRGKLLTKARMLLRMDPKDPVLGGAAVTASALNAGLVKAWVKTAYDVDQPAACTKFETLLGAGKFYDAAVAGANLQHRGPALLALAIAAKTPEEAAGVGDLLGAGKTLSEPAREEVTLALIKNPATSAALAVGLVEYGGEDDGTQESANLKTRNYEALVRLRPHDPEVCEAGLNHLRDALVWLPKSPTVITNFAASLLESGASMREVLEVLEPDPSYDRSDQMEVLVDRFIATLITEVAAKTPAGLQDVKASFTGPDFFPLGPATVAAARKVGALPPRPAQVPPEPTTW